jgi:hypothetical protein
MEQEPINTSNFDGSWQVLDLSPFDDCVANFDKPLILYSDRKKAINALTARMAMMFLLICCFDCALIISTSPQCWPQIIGLILYCAAIYLFTRRKHARKVLPVLQMANDGIEIHSMNYDLYIPWEEIEEVRAYWLVVWQLDIVPYDLSKTLAHGTFKTKAMGLFNGICIQEEELPLSAKDVAILINERKNYALGIEPSDDRTRQLNSPTA